MELGFDPLKAGGVNGGADVDRGCEEADLKSDEELFGSGPIPRVLRVV